jgi:serine/threonine protein kinase
MLNNIEQNKIFFPKEMSPEAKSLIQQLLQKNPMIRLGASQRDAEEIKEHEFFKSIVWNDMLKK